MNGDGVGVDLGPPTSSGVLEGDVVPDPGGATLADVAQLLTDVRQELRKLNATLEPFAARYSSGLLGGLIPRR